MEKSPRLKRGKIRTKLIIRLIFVALIPLILLVVFSWRNTYRTRINSVSELETTTILQAESAIKKWINERFLGFRIKLTTPSTAPPIILSSEAAKSKEEVLLVDVLKVILRDILQNDENLEEASFISLEGEMQMKILKGDIETELETEDFTKTEGFIKGSEGQSFFGKIFFEEKIPKTILFSPVLDPQDKTIAVFKGKVNLTSFQEILEDIEIGRTGYLYLVDRDGNIIAHSQKSELIGENVKEIEGVKKVLRGESRRGLEKEDRYIGVCGEKVIGATLPVFNFGIITEWPEKEALEIVRLILNSTLRFALLTLVAITSIAFLFAQGVARPIREIQEGSKIIGKGNFDYRIKVKTNDEIEELAENFNEMTKDLKEVQRLRDVEIKSKALAKSLAKERELSEVKDTFIKTAAHQLRTPASAIKLAIEFLSEKRKEFSSEIQEFLDDALSGTKDLANIVNDLVAVSEFGFGRYKLENPKPIDIVKVTEDIIDKYKFEIKEKKLNFQFQKPPEILQCQSTLRAMRFITQNLIDNAVCYTKKGGKIILSIRKVKNFIEFKIEDTGIGIPDSEKKLIFSECFRASNAIEQKNVGTGLGLYLTKNIIEAHNGKIWFESEKEKGSTFYFTLPVIKKV